MKFYLKLGFILLAFCIVATGILAYVNSITKPKIDKIKADEEILARESLIPESDFERIAAPMQDADSLVYFIARDKQSKEVKGYTFIAAKIGYSSKVKTMAAVDASFNILNIKVIDQAETPGLGANCQEESFKKRFQGLNMDKLLVDKDGGTIESLTGATITTRAITNSLKEQIILLRKDIESRATILPTEEKA